ncbi:MAG: phosphoglycolate phosphatase [Desulfurococcales archaeon]|nr:phosphoglycolate phosphatase [Desulfurococcales archaeon]
MAWKPRLVLSDIDGTLTVRRGSLLLSLEAVEAVRMLEGEGVPVSLVTGNSVPVAAGLARYIGASGPVVAENGCTVFHRGELHHVCDGRPPGELESILAGAGFRASWQNPYRHHDLAFLPPGGLGPEEALAVVRSAMEEVGWDGVVLWSGFAFHIAPRGASKTRGAALAASLLGAGLADALAVGDGENDLDLLEAAGVSAAPGDAAERVRARVDYVASKPGGSGFAEIARLALGGRLQRRRP